MVAYKQTAKLILQQIYTDMNGEFLTIQFKVDFFAEEKLRKYHQIIIENARNHVILWKITYSYNTQVYFSKFENC